MCRQIYILMCFCLFSSGAIGQVEGRLILDRTNIYSSMPISGIVELAPKSDVVFPVRAEVALSFMSGGAYVEIIEPSGNMLLINRKTILGDLDAYSMPLFRGGVLTAGTTYAIPIFLLKTSDRFIFDLPGKYEVSFVFPALPGDLEFVALVDVQESDSCGRKIFEELFYADVPLVHPFGGGLRAATCVPDSILCDYNAAFAVSMAYQYSGAVVVRPIFRLEFSDLGDRGWYQTEKIEDRVRIGLKWDAAVANSCGVWPIVSKKLKLLQDGIYDTTVDNTDAMGRVIILSN